MGDLGIESPASGIKLENARFQVRDGFIRLDAGNPSPFGGAPAKEGSCLQD